MRTGLVICAALASALVASTALADRTNDYDNKSTHSKEIKERVIEQERNMNTRVRETSTSKTTDNSAAAKIIQAKTDHHAQGELYDSYGKSGNSRSVTTSHPSSLSRAATPAKLKPGQEEMVDPKNSKGVSYGAPSAPNYGPMGFQVKWTATNKTVRSFVHMVNDKGQLNNNPHGSTATAMHSRHQMSAILAVTGRPIKLFSWEGSGGDASEDQF